MRNFEKMEVCNLGPEVMEEVYAMTGVDVNAQKAWTTRYMKIWYLNVQIQCVQ